MKRLYRVVYWLAETRQWETTSELTKKEANEIAIRIWNNLENKPSRPVYIVRAVKTLGESI